MAGQIGPMSLTGRNKTYWTHWALGRQDIHKKRCVAQETDYPKRARRASSTFLTGTSSMEYLLRLKP